MDSFMELVMVVTSVGPFRSKVNICNCRGQANDALPLCPSIETVMSADLGMNSQCYWCSRAMNRDNTEH